MANAPRKNSTKAREALRATSKNTVHPYFIARPDKDAANASWTVAELCKEYGWPEGLAGGGKIALIHCSGGWRQEDIDAYFADPKLRPIVTDHSVDLITKNSECKTANVADTEVALDIQVAGAAYAIATGKSATIRIYWSQDLVAGLRAASDDKCDVCCITWGADENNWGRAAAYAFDAVAEKATKKGMIIIAASGDNDSSDGGSTPANVDFPASSPHVIGVGGTTRTKDAKVAENVWNDNPGEAYGNGTGGGVSEFFPIPKWQLATIQSLNRIVPDVAAHADPNNGYQIIVGDESRVVGGTSAAAALYAGLFAAFGEKRGFILPELYKNQICFNDIREGDNGQFRALVGADACTGLGSPRAGRLASRIGTDRAAWQKRDAQLEKAEAEIQRLIVENQRLRTDARFYLNDGEPSPFLQPSLANPAELRPRFVGARHQIDARAIVYGVLGIPTGSGPLKTDQRPLVDWGYTSSENFEVLADLVNSALLRAGASNGQIVDPNVVANCSDVGELISAVRQAISASPAGLRPRFVGARPKINARATVYGVLGIAAGSDPLKTDQRPLSDWGYTSSENFQVLTSLINSALLNAGASDGQIVDPNEVANCGKIGELIAAVRQAISS